MNIKKFLVGAVLACGLFAVGVDLKALETWTTIENQSFDGQTFTHNPQPFTAYTTCKFHNCTIQNCTIKNIVFDQCDFTGTKFQNCTFKHWSFCACSNSTMENFINCTFVKESISVKSQTDSAVNFPSDEDSCAR